MTNTLCDFTGGCTASATRWGLLAVPGHTTTHVATCEYHSCRWSALWGTWPMDSVDVDDAHAEALADALPSASVDTNNCPTYPCEGHMRRTECLGRMLMECSHCGRTYVHVLTDGGEWYRTGSSYALVRDGEIIREVGPRHWRDAYLTV